MEDQINCQMLRIHIPPIHVPERNPVSINLLCVGFLFGIIVGIFFTIIGLAILSDIGLCHQFCNET